jgi:carboxymethylenebutenolidase
MIEQRIDLQTDDGTMDTYIVRPDGTGPWPAVVLYMDAFGIRPDLRGMAGRLASHGYVVALPNLYYRAGGYAPFDPVEVAKGGAERMRFRAMIDSLDGTKVMRDTAAIVAHLDRDSHVKSGAMGAVGYCMGGRFALSAAGTFPDRVAAAASFHGTALATDRPDSPHLLASRMRAKVYVGVAELDEGFSAEQREKLEQALIAGRTSYAIETYEGAKHGFAVAGHLVFDRDASERHWINLIRLFHDVLDS